MPTRPPVPRSRRLAAMVVAVALLGVGACSDDSDDQGPGASGDRAGAPTQVSVGKVTGRLPKKRKRAAVRQVQASVDTWIDRAYAGEYPRDGFKRAFASFTPDARRRARKDRALMSNAKIGSRLESVRLVNRKLIVDVLAVGGRATAVTARVRLGMELAGEIERRDRVTGRLFLTRQGGGKWRVFGYEMERRRV